MRGSLPCKAIHRHPRNELLKPPSGHQLDLSICIRSRLPTRASVVALGIEYSRERATVAVYDHECARIVIERFVVVEEDVLPIGRPRPVGVMAELASQWCNVRPVRVNHVDVVLIAHAGVPVAIRFRISLPCPSRGV